MARTHDRDEKRKLGGVEGLIEACRKHVLSEDMKSDEMLSWELKGRC